MDDYMATQERIGPMEERNATFFSHSELLTVVHPYNERNHAPTEAAYGGVWKG